jgi:hypothetical protein
MPVLPSAAVRADTLELVGTWYVLVHYRDSTSADPEARRWDDHVWVFVREGTRLRWTVYPIVVLGDESGRFENLGTNRARRIVHAWEPSPEQQAIIDGGPPVNMRGARTKSLRPDGRGGWKSVGRTRARTATSLAYSETWTIEGEPARPTFRRIDSLTGAGGVAPAEDGFTRYVTREVSEDGSVVRGDFQRDDLRVGTFRMLRTPPVRGLESKSTPSERLRQHFLDQNLGPGLVAPRDGAGDEAER